MKKLTKISLIAALMTTFSSCSVLKDGDMPSITITNYEVKQDFNEMGINGVIRHTTIHKSVNGNYVSETQTIYDMDYGTIIDKPSKSFENSEGVN